MFISRKSGLTFVHRNSEAGPDFNKADIVADNTWRNLDISEVVPVNAKLVLLAIHYEASTAGHVFNYRHVGCALDVTAIGVDAVVGNRRARGQALIPLPTGPTIQYKTQASCTYLYIAVTGWFI